MNRKFMLPLALVTALSLAACQEETTAPVTDVDQPAFELGNGYPVPSFDYQMQIIGVPKGKTADMTGNQGHRIFVMLEGGGEVTNPGGKNNQLKASDVNKIYLCNSTANENDVTGARGALCDAWRTANQDDFGVIDANGTDADGAMFGIPDPCSGVSSIDGCTPRYAIWARALAGKGSATITTCADETGTGFDGVDDIWCGDNGITLSKQTANKAVDVSGSLLFMHINVTADNDQLLNCIEGTTGVDYLTTRSYDVYLFDRCFENYFWNYDNNGLKLLQLRFYFAPAA